MQQVTQIKSFLILRCRNLLLAGVVLLVLWFSLDLASEKAMQMRDKNLLSVAGRMSGGLSMALVISSGIGVLLGGSFED